MALTTIPKELVLKAWAKNCWEAGLRKCFFQRFTGNSSDNIVQIKTDLQKGRGDSINIPLLLPLKGTGISGDNMLEGNEEAMIYRSFDVSIDQVRNAVRLTGRFEEQKTQQNMREDARTNLSNWLADTIDKKIFKVLSTSPSADRVVYAGSANSENTIGAADVFSTDIIGEAKRLATADEDTAVRPIRINGADRYIMIIDQYQARDLMKDARWLEAQQYANIRGEKNPIFTGALGMYNGVVIHQCNRVLRTDTGASNTKVGHALFLGAQAAVMAVGNNPRWDEKTFDYGNQYGVSFGRMFGIKKSEFDYDGDGEATDYGCVNVMTSSVDD